MANTFLTISMVTRETLRVLTNEIVMCKSVMRNYDKAFGVAGAKIGNVLNVRKPVRFVQASGQGLILQDLTETDVPVTLSKQYQRSFEVSSQDLALNIDDFSERFITPAMDSMANEIDYDGFGLCTSVWNYVGTPGTTPNALLTYLQAKALLNKNACPMDGDRSNVINEDAEASIVDALKGLFQDSASIAMQYKKGVMGRTIGSTWKMSQNVNTQIIGPLGGTPLVSGAGQTGNSLLTTGWTASTLVLGIGDRFTIAGVFMVNPQSYQQTTQLQEFVVTAPVTSGSGAGAATIQIQPAITVGGAFATVNATPAAGAVITVIGAANTVSPQNMMFHKNAFCFANADLPNWKGVDMCSRFADEENGLSVRGIRAYDINQDRAPLRLDLLGGWAPLYPQLACIIYG